MEQINLFPKKPSSFYTPIWGPFLLTILSASILMCLGSWQIQRLEWKKGLLTHTQKIWHSPCLEGREMNILLNKILKSQATLQPISDRCYRIKGQFIFSTNLFLQSKMFSQKNKKIRSFLKEKKLSSYGVEVMTLFKTEGGEYVWINRGWAPLLNKKPLIDPASSPTQKISLYLKTSPKPSIFSSVLPKNIPNSKIWYTPDLPKMSEFFQTQAIPFVYGVQISKEETENQRIEFPIPELEMIPMPNNHLTYAFIWYSLGTSSLLIYGIYHRRQRLQERERPPLLKGL